MGFSGCDGDTGDMGDGGGSTSIPSSDVTDGESDWSLPSEITSSSDDTELITSRGISDTFTENETYQKWGVVIVN